MEAGRQHTFLPGCECLEGRELLASQLTANLSGGVLKIEGTYRNDTINVRQDNNRISVDGVDIQIGSYRHDDVSVYSVRRIEVRGLGGHDLIRLNSGASSGQQTITRATAVWSGSGDDIVWTDGGPDTVFAGDGRDAVYSGGGTDKVDGGTGNDRLEGGDGNDELRGGTGHDILLGGDHNDRLWGGEGDDDLRGGINDDRLDGGSGRNRFDGSAGNDFFYVRGVTDRLNGGSGQDTGYFLYASAPQSTNQRHAGTVIGMERFLSAATNRPAPAVAPQTGDLAAHLRRLTELLQMHRRRADLPELKLDDRLTRAAQYQADYMARTGYYSHVNKDGRDLWDRLAAVGIRSNWAGENIHMYDPENPRTLGLNKDYAPSRLPDYFYDGWRFSEPHEHNMSATEPTHMGVALARSRSGLVYAVQVVARL